MWSHKKAHPEAAILSKEGSHSTEPVPEEWEFRALYQAPQPLGDTVERWAPKQLPLNTEEAYF